MQISKQTARRFILGKQGLWPGRRWRGKKGTEQAMRAMEYVQLDPLHMMARSQDIKLHSRVIDYEVEYMDALTYKERKFFDWGNWLAIRPMEELPYWRALMQRVVKDSYYKQIYKKHDDAVQHVLQEIKKRGPLGNRDFEGFKKVTSYRARKDTGMALHALWIEGKLMTHGRNRFEKTYDFAKKIVPREFDRTASEEESDLFIVKKLAAFYGISKLQSLYGWLSVPSKKNHGPMLVQKLLDQNILSLITVEGWPGKYYVLSEDLPLLKKLEAGEIPKDWKPLETTTQQEVSFLAPLDVVSARGRSKLVFDFDYVWEVYKPEHQRKWGYYVLPILWGDQLIARMDPKLDRDTQTLHILGFWLEDNQLSKNDAFIEAYAMGLYRLAKFLGAKKIDVKGIKPALIKKRIKQLC